MPLTDSGVRSLTATDKMQKKGGGKSFYGEVRFPLGGGGKLIRVCIGPYGTAPGQWTLKAAKDEWTRIRAWSLETGRDPRELNGRGRHKDPPRRWTTPYRGSWAPRRR